MNMISSTTSDSQAKNVKPVNNSNPTIVMGDTITHAAKPAQRAARTEIPTNQRLATSDLRPLARHVRTITQQAHNTAVS